jgi:hypothetical protein
MVLIELRRDRRRGLPLRGQQGGEVVLVGHAGQVAKRGQALGFEVAKRGQALGFVVRNNESG